MNLAGGAVIDARALRDEDPHRQYGVFFDDDAFDDFGARADEAVVFDDGGAGLQGLQHAADAHAARQVDMAADLRARAYRGPGVHHRAFTHARADVDVRGHQHRVGRDVGAAPHRGGRDHAKAATLEILGAVVLELQWHFVVVQLGRLAHDAVVGPPEGQQHGFLDPLVN